MGVSHSKDLQEFIAYQRTLVDALLLAPPKDISFGPDHLRHAVMAYLERPAKRLRPAIVLLANQVVGGDLIAAVPAAAAVELYHTWTLIHDDVIDGDVLRRGQPTVHVLGARWGRRDFGLSGDVSDKYGRDTAILAGDALHGWSVASLLGCVERGVAPALVVALLRRLNLDLTPRLLEGEMLDVQFSHQPVESIGREKILRMMELKTGALLEFAASTGAAIGTGLAPGNDARVDALGRYASLCGIAFQLQDDILGILGDEARLGKPIGSDIREGKATLLVHHALAVLAPAARAKLLDTLGRRDASPAAVVDAIDVLQGCGAVEATRTIAENYLSAAIDCLVSAVPPSRERGLLEQFAESMVERVS